MKYAVVLLIAVLLFACIPFVFGGRGGLGSAGAAANPSPTPERPLTKASVDALLEKLLDSLAQTLEDDDSVDFLTDRWSGRKDLTGKTRRQIIEILFDDLRTLLDDEETLGYIWSNWTGEKTLPKAKAEPPKPKNEPMKPAPSQTP
jgi:hypothetical protein